MQNSRIRVGNCSCTLPHRSRGVDVPPLFLPNVCFYANTKPLHCPASSPCRRVCMGFPGGAFLRLRSRTGCFPSCHAVGSGVFYGRIDITGAFFRHFYYINIVRFTICYKISVFAYIYCNIGALDGCYVINRKMALFFLIISTVFPVIMKGNYYFCRTK